MTAPTTIRAAKRRARQTELGLILALWLLFAEAWKRTWLPFKLVILAALYIVATIIVRYWPVAVSLLVLWIIWRVYTNVRLRAIWGSVGTWKLGRTDMECPFCEKVHPAAQWCTENPGND